MDDGGFAFPGCWHPDMGWSPRDTPDGMTLRDYLMAHAPALPPELVSEWWRLGKMNDPELFELPWNDDVLDRTATLYSRWAEAYADAILSVRKSTEGATQ